MANTMGLFELLTTMNERRTLHDFDDQLHDLLKAVKSTGKKGKVSLTLEVQMLKDAELPSVEIQAAVASTVPRVKRLPERLYLTDDGGISRRNPRQPELPDNTIAMDASVDGKSLAAGEKA